MRTTQILVLVGLIGLSAVSAVGEKMQDRLQDATSETTGRATAESTMRKALFILYVEDQDRSREFYEVVLGAKPTLDVPGMTEFHLTETSSLGIMPEQGIASILGDEVAHPHTGNGIPRCELYLLVPDPAESYGRLLEAGGKGISPPRPRPWGDLTAYGMDPDGHVVAFGRPLEK